MMADIDTLTRKMKAQVSVPFIPPTYHLLSEFCVVHEWDLNCRNCDLSIFSKTWGLFFPQDSMEIYTTYVVYCPVQLYNEIDQLFNGPGWLNDRIN